MRRTAKSLLTAQRLYSQKIQVLRSTSTNPFVNLATEDWLLNDCDPAVQTLFLWRNDKTVVIGKHQNPWKECHVQQLEADQVHLARRRSGGGAVYQDLGNTIFTFLSPKDAYDKVINFQLLQRALRNGFNIQADLSGRNDIVVDGRKISGSAFKVGKHSALHHGTFLVHVDMNALQRYLNPHKLKLASKGVTSVVSRVVNLQELVPQLNHDTLCAAITNEFFTQYNTTCPIEDVNLEKLAAVPSWKKYYDELSDWKWRFGETPHFSHNLETRFDWGLFDVYMEAEKKGIISQVKIFSDTLFPVMVELFQQHLLGKPYSAHGVQQATEAVVQDVKLLALGAESEGTLIQQSQQLGAWIATSL